jgi:hypothetical protein
MYHQAVCKQYLIKFIYDGWYGEVESRVEMLLVTAKSYRGAIAKIAKDYDNARDFVNKTL